MVQYELVLEVREYLSEHAYTCFFTNYHLEHMGTQLSDYCDLSELDLEADNKIYMRAQNYDEKSARHHIKRVVDIFTSPCVLNTQQTSPEEEALNDILQDSKMSEEEKAKEQEVVVKQLQAKQEQKQKVLYENFLKIVEKDKKQDYILPKK